MNIKKGQLRKRLQSVTKLVRRTALNSFFNLGTTLNQGEGRFWVSLVKPNIFLGLFHENIVSLDKFYD